MHERSEGDGMQHRGVYGAALASCFGVIDVPSYIQRTLKRDIIAASHVRLDEPRTELTQSVRCDDAYLLTVHLRDLVDHELWAEDRLATTAPLQAGISYLYELDRDPQAR